MLGTLAQQQRHPSSGMSEGTGFGSLWKLLQVMAMHQGDCQRLGTCNAFAPPEAIMGVSLVHPHLVRGYKYAVATHHASQLPEGTSAKSWHCWCQLVLLCVCSQAQTLLCAKSLLDRLPQENPT